MLGMLVKIRQYWDAQKNYFLSSRDSIMASNLSLLRKNSIIEMLFVGVFILLTPLLMPSWKPSYPYLLFLTMAVIDVVISHLYFRLRHNKTYDEVQLLCALFYIVTLAGCMAIDIMPSPEQNSTFFHIIIVALPSLFILPVELMFFMDICAEILYVLFLWIAKYPDYALSDSYSSIVGLTCSVIVMLIVSYLRVSEGLIRMRYIRQGTTDLLTNVLNRSEFELQMSRFFAGRVPADNEFCALIMFDIDSFKNINDTYGHQAGDHVLAAFGSLLRESFRSDDIIGRIGGDEFMVLLTKMHSESDAQALYRRIVAKAADLKDLPEGYHMTFSMGVAELHGTSNYEELYRIADEALYEAKSSTASCIIRKIDQ